MNGNLEFILKSSIRRKYEVSLLPEQSTHLNKIRHRVGQFIEKPMVNRVIMSVIVINAITLGLETSSSVMERVGPLLIIIDRVVLTFFTLELLTKLFVYGRRFFTSGWNIFDFLIIVITIIPFTGNLSILRSLRILRVLRQITLSSSMRRVVSALLRSIPGVSSVIALLVIVYYVFAVLVTNFFGASFPVWFGTIGKSMYSLFQIMALESLSDIVQPVMEQYPWAWLVFVPYILLTGFVVINLFVAVIVEAMSKQIRTDVQESKDEISSASKTEISDLFIEIDTLQRKVEDIKKMIERR